MDNWMRKTLWFTGILVLATGLGMACDAGNANPDQAGNGPESNLPDWLQTDASTSFNPSLGAEDCAYDPQLRGKEVGDHVGNLSLVDHTNQRRWLHSYCGGQHEAIWVILAAGW